jgi:hypothetical protein
MTLEDTGYCAYYQGVSRSELETEEERRGWDEAYGEDSYYRAIWEEYRELCDIGRDESLRPYLY